MSLTLATERTYRTADGRYVRHGHVDATLLAAIPGGPLPADFNGFADEDAPTIVNLVLSSKAIDEIAAAQAEPPADEPPADPAPKKPRKS